jgi:hypothetical protein
MDLQGPDGDRWPPEPEVAGLVLREGLTENSSAGRPESFSPSTNQLLAVVAGRSKKSACSLRRERVFPKAWLP